MPRFPVSPYWSSNPNIPIYLEQGQDTKEEEKEEHHTTQSTTHGRHVPEFVCATCETSSRDTPIHCVSVSPSPAPPSYSSLTPLSTSPRHLTVPTLTIETPRQWSRPQPPTRSLQFDPEGRPHVRFRRNAFSPVSPAVTEFDEAAWTRQSRVGLGIGAVPFRSDSSPITPGTAEKRGEENAEDIEKPSNWAQRLEEKLWNYSASRNVVKRWILEIISWSLSAACMAGIVIMLFKYRNQRIPKWPLGLTLNAYISILAKVASAALMLPVSEALGQLKWSWFHRGESKKMWDFEIFDNASRGPWGSFILLVRTKGRTLAALGACVTLFALALDPFFQQVVEYPEHWRLQPDGKGQIQIALGYNPFQTDKVYQTQLQSVPTDQPMLALAEHYFYDNGTVPMNFGKGVRAELPLGCSNSNCTWPEYETFGVTSECVDATDRLEFKCRHGLLDWIQQPVLDPDLLKEPTYPNGTACGWWLKADKPLLMTGYDVDKHTAHAGEVLIMRTQPLYDILSREFIPGYEPHLNNSRNPLSHVVIVSGHDLENIHQNSTPIAHECMISWAAKTVSSKYTSGGYIEEITSTIVNSSVGESPWLTNTIYSVNEAMTLYDYTYLEETISLTGHNGTQYMVNNFTQLAIVSMFDDIFPSSYTLVNSTNIDDAMLRFAWWRSINPRTRNMTFNAFLYDNVTTHLDLMATSMTNLIRSAPTYTKMVEGEAFDLESFVDVRWWWMTLPLGLLTFTGLFLLATVIRSSREQDHVGIYKTSAIATLMYGLPDQMSKTMAERKTQGTPRAQAKEVKVRWVPKVGWRFSGLSLSPVSAKSTSPVSMIPDTSPPRKAKQSPPPNWI